MLNYTPKTDELNEDLLEFLYLLIDEDLQNKEVKRPPPE